MLGASGACCIKGGAYEKSYMHFVDCFAFGKFVGMSATRWPRYARHPSGQPIGKGNQIHVGQLHKFADGQHPFLRPLLEQGVLQGQMELH